MTGAALVTIPGVQAPVIASSLAQGKLALRLPAHQKRCLWVQAWFCEACDCWVPVAHVSGKEQVWRAHVARGRHRRQAAAAARTNAALPLEPAANQESTSYYRSAFSSAVLLFSNGVAVLAGCACRVLLPFPHPPHPSLCTKCSEGTCWSNTTQGLLDKETRHCLPRDVLPCQGGSCSVRSLHSMQTVCGVLNPNKKP